MLALAVLVGSIGLADSLNPSTIGPALYLALGRKAIASVAAFTAGVFGVSLLGGIVLTFALRRFIPHPGPHANHLIEAGLGAALILLAAVLWLGRGRVAHHLAQQEPRAGRSPLLLGAGIMAVELPTAFPYFAAIAAIVAAGRTAIEEIALLALFNGAFVAPLLAILVLRSVAGERGARLLEALRAWLDRRAPVLLPALILVVGIALLLVGGIRLATE